MVGLWTRPAIERAGTETPHLQRGAPDFYPNGAGHRRWVGPTGSNREEPDVSAEGGSLRAM